MKKSIVIFTLFSTLFFANAQSNEDSCLVDAEILNQFIQKKDFEIAAKAWSELNKRCSNLTETFYKNGEIIFEYQKEKSNTFDAKKSIVVDIITVLNDYDAKFPKNKNQNGIKKAIYLSDYKLGTNDEIFSNLDNDFKKNKADFNNPQALFLYFETLMKQFISGKKGITLDDLYTKNFEIYERIEQELKISGKTETIESLKTVQKSLKTGLEPIITCENLRSYCEKTFDINQNNPLWLAYTAELLYSKSCYNSNIVSKIITKYYNTTPTSLAAYYYGYEMLLKNDVKKSDELFNEASDKQIDKTEKSKIYYTIATVVYGFNNRAKASDYLNKAIETDSTNVKSYLYLAQLYENATECLPTAFDKKAIYWLVAETVLKAGKANKIYEKSAKLQAEKHLKKAPTNQEIDTAGLKNVKNYSFKCWINQTVGIPKN